MNWKAKSAAAIVATGLFGAGETQAEPIGTNVVQNPSFENEVGGNVTNWTGSALGTYQYSQGYTSINVPPLPGLRYLHGLSGSASSSTAQTIDLLAAGFTSGFLDGGAKYDLSAFFSSYLKTDFGSITASFLNGGGTAIGTSNPIGGSAFITSLGTANNVNGLPGYTDWGKSSTSGALPIGTRSVLINVLHTRAAGTANDSYVDVVDFQLIPVPEPSTLLLTSVAAGITLMLRLRRRREASAE